jgi:hypothetical protein
MEDFLYFSPIEDRCKTNNSLNFYNYFLAECITKQPKGKGCGHATGFGYFDGSGESSKCASYFCEAPKEEKFFWGDGCGCGCGNNFIRLNPITDVI